MPDWLVERGIGETRAIALANGAIVEARILLDGTVPAGSVIEAQLASVRPGIAVAGSQEYLLPAGSGAASEGATVLIEVTRERIAGAEEWKRPLARMSDGPPNAGAIEGKEIAFPSPADPLADAGWDDLLAEAREGIVRFDGGELRLFATPAMTLIDVDGTLPATRLARVAASAAGGAIRRLAIGGSIGIDFPTVGGKAERQAVGKALDEALEPPFERTAMNGFGFMQIIRPRSHASLLELAADRAAFEARALLRRAARASGATTLRAHPAVIAAILAPWKAALERQVGGRVTLRADASLAMSAGDVD